MKQCKRLTRKQKEYLSEKRLNPNNWMLLKETEVVLVVTHKKTKTHKVIHKQEKPDEKVR